MSEFHAPNNVEKSVPQSEALPTMGGGSSHVINEGDNMNHNDDSNHNTTYNVVLANNNTSNSHPLPHSEEMSSPWSGNHPTYNSNHNHRGAHHPPPPHGSYPHPHEPPHHRHHHHHHHGGYHPPPPHYAYPPPPHDSHYPPPPHHHPPSHHHSSVHHYPPKYNPPPPHQMYHPGYYHPQPPPPYHHHYPPQQHHHPHGMPPPTSYPPPSHPHYSSNMTPQEIVVSPPSHRDDTMQLDPTVQHHPHVKNHTTNQSNQQHATAVNLVTPTIYTASPPSTTTSTPAATTTTTTTPATTTTTTTTAPAATTTGGGEACSSNDDATRMYTPNTPSLKNDDNSPNDNDDDGMTSPATKELFACTPHYLSNTTGGSRGGGGGGKQRKQRVVHKSILSKGLLPLDYTKDGNARTGEEEDEVKFAGGGGLDDSLLLPGATRHEEATEKNTTTEEKKSTNNDHDEEGGWMPNTAAVNTTTQISSSSSGSGGGIISPHQMAELQSISNQARATIAKMKQQQQRTTTSSRQVQQVTSQRVADIACEDGVRFGDEGRRSNSSFDEDGGAAVETTATAATTSATTTNATEQTNKTLIKKPHHHQTTPRYKDKDGFIYYRRVSKKHYKKLFEKGLVPKDNDGDDCSVAVEERVNAIQTITTTAAAAEEVGVVPVVHLPTVGGEGVEEEQVEQSLQLPRSRVHDTQVLYSHDETTRPVKNSSDGYELRVVPHDDGNDFHVELIKPDDVVEKEEESLMKQQQQQQHGAGSSVEENSSLPSMESDEKLEEKTVDGGGAIMGGGSKKNNDGEFDTAVDSILDAAETIAKRATPRSSPVSLPDSQYQQQKENNFDLPGVLSSVTKRKCEDMIQGYQEEKRQRSNSSGVAAFHPHTYHPAAPSSTFSYLPPDTVRPSPPPPHETGCSVDGPSPPSHASELLAPNNAYSQIICQDRKEKRGRRTYCYPHPSVDLTEYYSSRQVTKTKKEELTALALCAASHIQKEPVLFRAILLNMALERERYSPKKHSGGAPTHLKNLALRRQLSSQNDGGSSAADIAFMSAVESSGKKVIRDGFFWKDVPDLEKVLQKHMMEYYFMSENRPQSKKQQQFNNRLVSLVYQEAIARGFVFDPVSFSLEGHNSPLEFPSTTSAPTECAGNWIIPPGFNHKKLRDRIRCYYKTHVQNSKKRLGTLLKNPNKERNRDILLRLVNELRSQEHIELSSECVVALKRLKAEQDSIKGTVSTPDGTSPETTSSRPSSARHEIDDHHSQQTTTTTPYSPRATISDGGSGRSSSSTSSSHSVQNPHAAPQPESTMFSPFKHASLLSSMRQLDSQRH